MMRRLDLARLAIGQGAGARRTALAATARRGGSLALAALAVLPIVAFLVARPPVLQTSLAGGLLLLTLWRPEAGWLSLVALSPLGGLLARQTGSPWVFTEPLVLAFLAGWLAREAFPGTGDSAASRPSPRLALRLAGLFALAITASLAVQLIVLQVSTAFPLEFARFVWRFTWHDYFARPSVLPSVPGAGLLLEGVGVFAATTILATRQPSLTRHGAKMVTAAAAFAALLNLAALVVNGGLGGVTLQELLALRARYVIHDPNAAGSYFVMALFVAGGLATSAWPRFTWAAAAALALVGLWLSGSRTAIIAAPVALAAWLAVTWRRRRPAVKVILPALAVLVLATGWYLARNPRSAASRTQTALRWRAEMSATAVRMAREYPLLGVGPGLFYQLSYDFSSAEWRERIPRENAHNNFLQVLAELGTVGLASLLALVAAVLAAWYRRISEGTEPWAAGLGTGVAAFLLTWAAGHPMLSQEVAIAFWLVLGLTAAAGAAATGHPAARARSGKVVAAAALLVACLVPVTAVARLARADLTRDGRGFSQWHREADGTRFRWMQREAVLYVPASAEEVSVGLRAPGGFATVRATLEGRPVGQFLVGSEAWKDVRIQVPRGYSWASVPVKLAVRAFEAPAPAAGSSVETRVQVALPRVIR